MANKLVAINNTTETVFTLDIVDSSDAFGPHLEILTKRTCARLFLDLKSVHAVRDWCDRVIAANNTK